MVKGWKKDNFLIGEARGMNRGALPPRQIIEDLARKEAGLLKLPTFVSNSHSSPGEYHAEIPGFSSLPALLLRRYMFADELYFLQLYVRNRRIRRECFSFEEEMQ